MQSDRVTIDQPAGDGLSGRSWVFIQLDDRLVVDAFSTWTRPSTRHKPKVEARWSRLSDRHAKLRESDVPFDSEIAALAKALWIKQLEAVVSVGFQHRR